MKKPIEYHLKAFFFVIPLICLHTSCFLQEDDGYKDPEPPYYQFDENDRQNLLKGYNQIGAIYIYQNQDGQELKLELELSEIEKEDYSIGSFWGSSSTTFQLYDVQRVRFNSLTHNNYWALNFLISKINGGTLNGSVEFYLWNSEHRYKTREKYNPQITGNQMEINGFNYERVFKIESADSLAQQEEGYSRNVVSMLLDVNKGLIGFDDLDGNKWRLRN